MGNASGDREPLRRPHLPEPQQVDQARGLLLDAAQPHKRVELRPQLIQRASGHRLGVRGRIGPVLATPARWLRYVAPVLVDLGPQEDERVGRGQVTLGLEQLDRTEQLVQVRERDERLARFRPVCRAQHPRFV